MKRAAALLTVVLALVAAVAVRGQAITNLTVRWREPQSNAIPIARYTVQITATNLNGITNQATNAITLDVLGRTTTNTPIVIPNDGPWAVRVRAVNEFGMHSLWSTAAVFSPPNSVPGVEVVLTLKLTP